MFYTRLILALLSVILAVVIPMQGSSVPQGRMSGGSAVETLRRFPHHVLIKEHTTFPTDYESETSYCGGSIINERWILSAYSCIGKLYGGVLEISFQRQFLNKTNGSYSAVVNRDDAVHPYPTLYDDICLIKLPFVLIFSDTVQAVTLNIGSNVAAGEFVVMPGYDNSTFYGTDVTTPPSVWNSDNQMVYGMFSIQSSSSCRDALGKEFDEYLQYCAKPWGNSDASPSALDIGSGLLTDWPAKPLLVGIYTGSSNWNLIDIYTNVAKYYSWIKGVISNDIPA